MCLAEVFHRCIKIKLLLNYEKFHFMVDRGIILGPVVFSRGIIVDPTKVHIISSLPYPACAWEVCSFLSHVYFYKSFIKDFNKIALPLSNLLQKDVDFVY